eukprot:Plantae.Rhodophyta-Hildenbrandia_rubra.ctg631.p1 GENE.Plantae.Rhodophyta-Hildenbrandia_rubra.ctg631~~Plantae.Rhodophyta-Hildenbrandia_rubra.ctg631.p1  ORF type:complete len:1105 (-),score=227.49 Plantae.Rhodophyta-Hildenbrandia_rubra.ctg631:1088-4402(-)
MSTARRDLLLSIQENVQKRWEEQHIFEEDAPSTGDNDDRNDLPEKYFVTFPYPYMNGFLHLGHAFTLTKAEFAVGYKRMKGYKCLYPFGLHCTGMPIQACANKLKDEIEKFGNPPMFPVETENEKMNGDAAGNGGAKSGKSKKGKVASKSSKQKYQWQILKESGVPEDMIAKFADPIAWLRYFPGEAVTDLKHLGLRVDWRRSFITTDVNPYYDSFVRWQFNMLREKNKIKFGKRYSVYSPRDGQTCADHDRASGEGVQPQEYTLIKMVVQGAVPTEAGKKLEGKPVFLAAATLRPETMYGQTNCWVLPGGDYGAYELASGDVFIMTAFAARNASFQDLMPEYGKAEPIAMFKGSDLIGLPLKAPNAINDIIYVLPLMTVSMKKGTGVVTSVPSDAPDDYRGLMDLKEKENLRSKFGVKDEWVLPFDAVPIINTPGFGDVAAKTACEKFKIKSQNDTNALTNAKEEVYKAGFYNGTMLVGSMKGQPVKDAKTKIRDEMIKAGQAVVYSEPEKQVMSRSGDECVVALSDQWYLEYGEESWRAETEKCLKSLETFHPETEKGFTACLAWLKEWACSRLFGLGTKLPWDKQWVIESLSDSTIYMAYYTVAHMLQGGTDNLDGSRTGPAGITASQMTDEVWSYILLGKGNTSNLTKSGISEEVLRRMRFEFSYWYPLDLRVSGKDLVPNHLTFFMYNHVAIFPEEMWPRAIRSNGHMMINAEKMSKSTGNFLTVRQAISKYSSDGVRFALADAGDAVEDANFAEKTADDAILKLTTFIEFVKEGIEHINSMRTGELSLFVDRVFDSQMNLNTKQAETAYDKMLFRDALKFGFYELTGDLGKYREAVGSTRTASSFANIHRDLFVRYVITQTCILAPICPHVAEHVWSLIKSHCANQASDTIMKVKWPVVEEPDQTLLDSWAYLSDLLYRIRTSALKPAKKKKKGKGGDANSEAPPAKKDRVTVVLCAEAPEWQKFTISKLAEAFDEKAWAESRIGKEESPDSWWKFDKKVPKSIREALPPPLKSNKKIMPFVAMVKTEIELNGPKALDRTLSFDEKNLMEENAELIHSQLESVGIKDVQIVLSSDESVDKVVASEALPGVPAFTLSSS